MSHPYLLLWLQAPLQSWGYDSRFCRRDTLKYPTKSGILGLLCCALGAGGEQREMLTRFASLNQTVYAFVRKGCKSKEAPMLCDFHMVGSAYNDQDPWENLFIPKTHEGEKPVGGGVKLTYRNYLQEAYFAVAVEVPVIMAESLAQALQNPVWDLYLGRKNCVPTDFIYRGIFNTADMAFEAASKIAQEKSLQLSFKVLDGEHEGNVRTLNDVPLQFGECKQYKNRRVTEVAL